MNVILDIDETLVHSIPVNPSSIPDDSDLSFIVGNYKVYRRPYVDEFIGHILHDPWYRVGVWSAGTYEYVHDIVRHLFPDKSRLLFIMTHDDCNEQRQKPLSKALKLINQDASKDIECPFRRLMHDVILIDDKPGVTGYNHLNHLKMLEFEGDRSDIELKVLWQYLDANRYHSSEYLVSHWK